MESALAVLDGPGGGGVLGACLVYVDYADAFAAFEVAEGITRGVLIDGKLAGEAVGGAGVFATFPAFGTTWRNVFSEFLGTAVLLVGVRALSDRRNVHFRGYFEPLLNGLLVFAIGLSLGGLTGYAINPARDLGPRLAASLLGWGPAVFRSHDWYFWVPIVGPLAGGVGGILLYDLLVHPNLPARGRAGAAGAGRGVIPQRGMWPRIDAWSSAALHPTRRTAKLVSRNGPGREEPGERSADGGPSARPEKDRLTPKGRAASR